MQRVQFLLVTTTPAISTFSRHGVSGHTRTFVRRVASHIDYCNAVLVCARKATTNKLQRVLNAAARVVSGTHEFDRDL